MAISLRLRPPITLPAFRISSPASDTSTSVNSCFILCGSRIWKDHVNAKNVSGTSERLVRAVFPNDSAFLVWRKNWDSKFSLACRTSIHSTDFESNLPQCHTREAKSPEPYSSIVHKCDETSSFGANAGRAFLAALMAAQLTVLMAISPLISAPSLLPLGPSPAAAAGLLRMPPVRLNNSYWLVRAGESEMESRGVLNTNPVHKTNMRNGLSDEGKKQVVIAAHNLAKSGACSESCWIWPSITQRAYQAAEIIAYVSGMPYSRIVPEYSFLDARGLGAYEGQRIETLREVYANDLESPKQRPPPFTDGTPNESVNDVLVRVTQLMSVLETQYSGETVVIIAPDSDNLSVLEAALLGKDLREHSILAYAPGEVRQVDLSAGTYRPPPSGLLKLE